MQSVDYFLASGWKRRMATKPRFRVLPPVHANPGIAAAYRRRIEALIDEMNASLLYWLCARWKAKPPEMAMDDASPADLLAHTMRTLGRRWQSRFDDMAEQMARYYASSIERRTTGRLQQILDDAGWTVRFRVSPEIRDVMSAAVTENVGLISSVAEQHLQKVEGIVMRNVQTGNDLATMTREIQQAGNVTRGRAAFIARDQTAKMTSVVTRARQQQAGIERAVWMHSHGGKEPRPTHLRNDGKIYDVATGWFDPDPKVRAYIFPGFLINCRCSSRPVIEGFD
jgi:SPP1 gp7 family putative phage head morphogenesis protein